MKQRSAKVLAAVTLFVLIGAGAAHAMWAASGEGSGAAHATIMPTGSQPGATPVIGAIVVSWAQSVMSDGNAVESYTVSKEDVIGGIGIIVPAGGSCAGLVTTLSCTDNSIGIGSWVFRITPRQAAWIGTEGPPSTPPVFPLP